MTGENFNAYLKWFDRNVASRHQQKVVLLVDNCPAHKMESNLKWTNVVFLPPNVTSIVQPMDQGIIKTLKTLYRSKLLRKKLQLYEANDGNRTITIRDAITMIAEAWDDVRKPCIINCFTKGGFDVVRIRQEQLEEEAAEEAERIEEQATALLSVQVTRYNNLITTSDEQRLQVEDFVTLPHEDEIHEDVEYAEHADEDAGQDPGEGTSGAAYRMEMGEEEDGEEEEVEIDTSRKRGIQLITEFETYLQFQEIDPALLHQIKDGFNKLQEKMEKDHRANLKQKSIVSFFRKE